MATSGSSTSRRSEATISLTSRRCARSSPRAGWWRSRSAWPTGPTSVGPCPAATSPGRPSATRRDCGWRRSASFRRADPSERRSRWSSPTSGAVRSERVTSSRSSPPTMWRPACSSVYYAMKALIAPDVPPNDGCYRPLRVVVPPRTALDPDPDRPVVGGNHETSQRVVDAIFKALAPILPDRVAAGGPTTSGLLLFGTRLADGRWAILYEVHGGGEGATAAKDGVSAVRVHMSNVMNTPTEVIESEYPFIIEEHALRPGSAGDGHHRGGLGLRRAYRVLGEDVTLTTMFERRLIPPWGLDGGGDALPFRVTIYSQTGERVVGGKETLALRRGDLVLVET